MTFSVDFTVLLVCTANVCRSPLAAVVLEQALGRQGTTGQVQVISSGHAADPGAPACRGMTDWAARHGLPAGSLADHRSRRLDADLVGAADLVLTADRRARSAVLRMVPSAAGLTFTFREAALLADRVGPADRAGATDLPGDLNGTRGLIDLPRETTVRRTALAPWRSLRAHTFDVPDAHEDARVPHRTIGRLLVPAVETVADSLSARAPTR